MYKVRVFGAILGLLFVYLFIINDRSEKTVTTGNEMDFLSEKLNLRDNMINESDKGNVNYACDSATETCKDNSPTTMTENAKNESSPKVILFWNSHYNSKTYGYTLGREAFLEHNCLENRCFLTTERSNFYTADAVIFNTAQLRSHMIPPRPRLDQIWISYNKENPLRTGHWMRRMNDLFNLTLSYHVDPDTDILSPLGYLLSLSDTDVPLEIPSLEKIRRKSRAAAWVVSNCDAESSRNLYAKELAKQIEVDIYGNCSNTPCPGPYGHPECFKTIEKDHFFYLAFENGYCVDYISEKLYRTFLFDLVPIVLGGGDYMKQVPVHSFIDVRNFASPEDLAIYLQYLMVHPVEYQKYFNWRKVYVVASQTQMKRNPLCHMCAILHNATYPYKTGFNAGKYWNASEQCLVGESELMAVHLLPNSTDIIGQL